MSAKHDAFTAALDPGWHTFNECKGNDMTAKLTPRQNEIISEALVAYAVENFTDRLPKDLTSLRESLVAELKVVSSESSCL